MNKSQKIQAKAKEIVSRYENAATIKTWRGEDKPNPIKFVLGVIMPKLFKKNGKLDWLWLFSNLKTVLASIKALWLIAVKQAENGQK